VLTRTGGTDELVEDGVNGLTFDWSNVDALTSHLRLLARDRSIVRRMGAASRDRAMQFSWDAIADRYLDIFTLLPERAAANGGYRYS
jgi:phosphatidyl-myo-inositol dimannoside synthase